MATAIASVEAQIVYVFYQLVVSQLSRAESSTLIKQVSCTLNVLFMSASMSNRVKCVNICTADEGKSSFGLLCSLLIKPDLKFNPCFVHKINKYSKF